jgi:hypothetical protein
MGDMGSTARQAVFSQASARHCKKESPPAARPSGFESWGGAISLPRGMRSQRVRRECWVLSGQIGDASTRIARVHFSGVQSAQGSFKRSDTHSAEGLDNADLISCDLNSIWRPAPASSAVGRMKFTTASSPVKQRRQESFNCRSIPSSWRG